MICIKSDSFFLGRGAEVVINVTTSKQPEKQLASKILESLEDTQVYR